MNRSALADDGNVAGWFGDLMKDLAEAYPSMKLRERQIRVYAAALADLTPEQVKGAFGRAILECRWFPSVSEIRQFVGPSPEDRALLQWDALRKAAREVGAWASIAIEDAAAGIALKAAVGSWEAFCALEEGASLGVARSSFLAAYRDARRRLPPRAEPVRLVGLCEAASAVDAPGWVGRLTLDGQVVSERAQPALQAGPDVKRLTAGGQPS
jgi:hypothetical protein